MKTYLEEQKVTTLQHAAVRSDDYSLTHRSSFGKAGQSDRLRTSIDFGNKGVLLSSNSGRPNRFPSSSTCFYCKKRGHVMSECHSLEKKNQKSLKPYLLIKSESLNSARHLNMKADDVDVARSYAPFVSKGLVSLVDQQVKSPVLILRDTGATQSLILEGVLPFSTSSSNGSSILLQGIGLDTF